MISELGTHSLFEVRYLLTTQFFLMDRSSLNRSSLNQGFAER
jgi:hypothetical protein